MHDETRQKEWCMYNEPGYRKDTSPKIMTCYRQHEGQNKARWLLTMSDFGATLHCSLHRLASPFTTSALLPISRNKPMTFFRQVPILQFHIVHEPCTPLARDALRQNGDTDRLSMSPCSVSFKINTSSSIVSTSYSIPCMSGPNPSVISSINA